MICEEWKVSIRRACAALEFDRSTFHYRSRKHDQAGIEARIKAICETRVRYGYRRVHVMLQREGWDINIKRTYRIYNEMGLQLRNKTPKRRVKAKLRDDRAPATWPNDVWAMDFVHDQLATGKTIRVLTVVDTFSRFSPVIDPRFSYRAEDVFATDGRPACGAFGKNRISKELTAGQFPRAIRIPGRHGEAPLPTGQSPARSRRALGCLPFAAQDESPTLPHMPSSAPATALNA